MERVCFPRHTRFFVAAVPLGGFAALLACALALAGMDRPSRSFFSPARLADKRPPEPASCQSPLPEETRRGLLLSSGLLTFSAACVPRRFGTFAQFCLVQRRMEQVPSRLSYVDLQGAITMLSGSFCFVARSTPSVQFERVSPFSFAEVKVQCEPKKLQMLNYKCFDIETCPKNGFGSNTNSLHLHC